MNYTPIYTIFLFTFIRFNICGAQNRIYNDSLNPYFNLAQMLNKFKDSFIHNKTNETDLMAFFRPELYNNPLVIANDLNETTIDISEMSENMSSPEDSVNNNYENEISEINESNNELTSENIIPAMPGIPIFREPPQIRIHDPDEGPIDPYYYPNNETDDYPTTSEPNQQFVFMKRPEFVAEKGSLEEKYKQLLVDDKDDDDITFPPDLYGQDFSKYFDSVLESTEVMSTEITTTIPAINRSAETLNPSESYSPQQLPYPYGLPYNPYLYGLPQFMPNYNPRFIPPLYPGYYPNNNFGKPLFTTNTVSPELITKHYNEMPTLDPIYKMLPKSYLSNGAHIEKFSYEENGSKDMSAGDPDSLEVFAPLELRQEEDIELNITTTTMTTDYKYNKMLNKSFDFSETNNINISDEENKGNQKKYPRIRVNSRRRSTKSKSSKTSGNNNIDKHNKVMNNSKRMNSRSHRIVDIIDNKNHKLSKFMEKEEKNLSNDFHKHNIYQTLFASESPANTYLNSTKLKTVSETIPTPNPLLVRRYQRRRLIARKQHNKQTKGKKAKHNNQSSHRKSKSKHSKNSENVTTVETTVKTTTTTTAKPSRVNTTVKMDKQIPKQPINSVGWKQTSKPKFLLRAKLRNSNQLKEDSDKSDKWWLWDQPSYCLDPIFVVSDCDNKKKTKIWSYDVSDQKCYFYDDLCSHLNKNSFPSSEECFHACWRLSIERKRIGPIK